MVCLGNREKSHNEFPLVGSQDGDKFQDNHKRASSQEVLEPPECECPKRTRCGRGMVTGA